MKNSTDSDAESSLLEIADAINNGLEVDWDSAESSALKSQRPLVNLLKEVSRVVSAYKDIPQSEHAVIGEWETHDTDRLPTKWGTLEIIEKIGAGAFGEVYRAREPRLNREVALKPFYPQRSSPSRQTSRIIEEGRLLARVHHHNIVTVHGAKLHAGQIGIWMEFIEGSTLEDILNDQGPLSAEEAMRIGRDVCQALAVLHNSGVVHRDIKARNVMRETGGRLVLMDLGVSCEIDRQVSVQQYGTPLYAAPEVLLENKSTPRSDIYSVGVLLFHLVTGKYPVSGLTLADVCHAHQAHQVQSLTELHPDLPRDFTSMVEKALAPDPAQRYATAVQFAQALADALGEGYAKIKRPGEILPSVAVLPFQDLSSRQDQGYLCEGLAEEIINALTQLTNLRVVGRDSSFTFKGRQVDLCEIGRRLNVEIVLEGQVKKIDTRLQISAQLINVSDGHRLWSDQFDGGMENVLAIQEKITVAVADKVASFKDRQKTIIKKHTEDIEAYDLYLKGRYLLNMGTREDIEKAIGYFEGAIELDANYAPAYIGLYDSYFFLYTFVHTHSKDYYHKAKISAQNAIMADPQRAEAHSAMGMIRFSEWEWNSAERSLRKAIELNTHSTSAHYYYSFYLMAMGRLEDAIDEMKRALNFDPLSRSAHSMLGVFYLRARKLDTAREHFHHAIDLQKDAPWPHTCLAQTYMLAKEYEAGLAELKKAAELEPNESGTLAALGWGYAKAGRRQEAQRILEELIERRERGYIRPFLLAKVHCGLGNHDQAFAWLEKAVEESDPFLLGIQTDETIDDIRHDPRYEDILRRMKLGTGNEK